MSRLVQWIVIGVLIVLILFADALGQVDVSWGLGGLAVVMFFVIRSLRLRSGRSKAIVPHR